MSKVRFAFSFLAFFVVVLLVFFAFPKVNVVFIKNTLQQEMQLNGETVTSLGKQNRQTTPRKIETFTLYKPELNAKNDQFEVFDTNKNSYATIAQTQTNKPADLIVKYDLATYTNMYNSISEQKTAGKLDWTVAVSDLYNVIKKVKRNNDALNNNYKITALSYSAGGAIEFQSLFVILNITEGVNMGSYLFQIQWNNQSLGVSGTLMGGQYRLATILSSTNIFYNHLTLETAATHSFYVWYLPSYTNDNQQDYVVKFLTVANSFFDSTSSQKQRFFVFKKDDLHPKLVDDHTYLPVYSGVVNSTLFFVLKDSNKNSAKPFVIVRSVLFANNNNEVIISNERNVDNVINLPVSNLNVDSKLLVLNLQNNWLLFLTTKSNSYYSSSLLFTEKGLKLEGFQKHNNTISSALIHNLSPIYTVNDQTSVQGYYALNADDQVIRLNTDFSLNQQNPLFYDFKAATTYLGSIRYIITKPGDNNWYPVLSDGKVVLFSGVILLGQLDNLQSTSSYELPVKFRAKTKQEIDPEIFFTNVLNNQGSGIDGGFMSFLNTQNRYQSFLELDTNFSDPRLAGLAPLITITPTLVNQAPFQRNSIYQVQLQFKQTLRKITNNQIDANDSQEIILTTIVYTFNNALGVVRQKPDISLPFFLTQKYPSEIVRLIQNNSTVNQSLLAYFLEQENVINPTYRFSANDTNGSLVIVVQVPYIYSNETGIFQLLQNKIFTFNFGQRTPLFRYNPFGMDSNNVFRDALTPIDQTFFTDNQNNITYQNQLQTLKNRYQTILASRVNKMAFYDDFLIKGSVFTTSNNLVVLPQQEQIQVVADDLNGQAYVSITFPQIGPKNNYTISFLTPNVFLKNPFASQTVYFAWKSNETVTMIQNQAKERILPSKVASLLNTTNILADKLRLINHFVVFSSFYTNLIANNQANFSAEADDAQGILTLRFLPKTNVDLNSATTNEFVNVFSGFQKNQNSLTNSPTVVFRNYSGSKAMKPSAVQLDQSFISNWSSLSAFEPTITLVPFDATGVLAVVVSLKNYTDNNVFYSNKTVWTWLSGFQTSTDVANLIVWKTNAAFATNVLPSALVRNIVSNAGLSSNPQYLYNQLNQLAFLSAPLQTFLIASPEAIVSLFFNPDDENGLIDINLALKVANQILVFNQQIKNLQTNKTIANASFASENNLAATSALSRLQTQLPSAVSLSDNDFLALFHFEVSSHYKKEVELIADDYAGSLRVILKVIDPTDTNKTISQLTKTFQGFQTDRENVGINWTYIGLAMGLPLLLFVPILFINFFFNRRSIKKIAGRLNQRLGVEYKKKQNLI